MFIEVPGAALPDSEMQVLEGCGHVPTLTQPNVVADAMRAFLQRRGAPHAG